MTSSRNWHPSVEPLKVCITGAAGRIAYSFIQSLSKGDVFGHDQPMIIHMLDVEQCYKAMEGIVMEIEDLASDLIIGCTITTDPLIAFKDVDVAVLLASMPHLKGIQRIELLKGNNSIYMETGRALEAVAKKTTKILVVANPSNTNALITMKYAPSIPRSQFTALSFLDHNRATATIAKKLGVNPHQVKNMIIWGNHSATMYPDTSHAIYKEGYVSKSVSEMLQGHEIETWLKTEFVQLIRQRFQKIISRRGMTTMSTGKAIADHLQYWFHGTPTDTFVSMAVPSDGSYGVPRGVFFSFPVVIDKSGHYTIHQGLKLSDFTMIRIEHSYKELTGEAELALKLAAEAELALKLAEESELVLKLAEEAEVLLKVAEENKLALKLAEEIELDLKLAEEAELALKLAEESKVALKVAEEAELVLKLEEESELALKLAKEAEFTLKVAEEAKLALKLAEESELTLMLVEE